MKYVVMFISFLIFAVFCSTAAAGGYKERRMIDIESVEYIEIAANDNKAKRFHLTEEQSREFIDRWNGASPIGPCKFYAKYIISVHNKDSETRTFRAMENTVKEEKDYCFDLKDFYLESVWKTTGDAH